MITGIRPAGRLGLLLELASLDDVLALHQYLKANPLAGQIDAVAAARTIMVTFSHRDHVRSARQEVTALTDLEFTTGDSSSKTIEVVYDGEDLASLAETLQMSTEALIAWHSGQKWRGAFGGFAPGFTYCTPLESAQAIPRRSSPRTRVPEKSVAVAGEFSAVYPRVSPGGWQLIGRTSAQMWDLSREHPGLVAPGDTVEYVPVPAERLTLSSATEHSGGPEPDDAAEAQQPQPGSSPGLSVEQPGMQLLIQDLGRPGYSDLGVSRAGVADEAAARQANRLVGNPEDAAVLEALQGGAALRATGTLVMAATGAELPLSVTAEDGSTRNLQMRTPFVLTAGDLLQLGQADRGLRTVLAIRGGITGQSELGSLSSDTMSGLGPAALSPGNTITAGNAAGRNPVGEPEPSTLASPDETGALTLRFTYGPREDWFEAAEQQRLATQAWKVTQQANRIGIRLEPAVTAEEGDQPRPLQRARNEELPSEGVARGSLQMPPQGNPVLFLNDHPVTGGYPVIGVIIPQDLPAAAQLRPGETLRLRPVDPDTLTPLTLGD